MIYRHTPAGNPVSLRAAQNFMQQLQQLFQPFYVQWYDSGTSALAAAVRAVVARSSIQAPEVLLPAYGCPALVSAVLHAGAKPVLVDLEPDSCWMSLAQLQHRLTPATVAVIAVDLFGIPEQGLALRKFARAHRLILIEDSAQYFPAQIHAHSWFGDYVVLSFGRGKPVSVLQGGAVLTLSNETGEMLPVGQQAMTEGLISRGCYRLKVALYNRLLSPYIYWLPESLPWLELGKTHYKTLLALRAVSPGALRYLPDNIRRYSGTVELTQRYLEIFIDYQAEGLRGAEGLRVLPCVADNWHALSRFPVLAANKAERDKFFKILSQQGVGVSRMYQRSLPEIVAIPEIVAQQTGMHNAARFADCILTLPLHSRIGERELRNIHGAIKKINIGKY